MIKWIKRVFCRKKVTEKKVLEKIDVVKSMKKRVSVKVGKFKETAPGCLTADVSVDVKPIKKKTARKSKK